jgi:hypothetical protein
MWPQVAATVINPSLQPSKAGEREGRAYVILLTAVGQGIVPLCEGDWQYVDACTSSAILCVL